MANRAGCSFTGIRGADQLTQAAHGVLSFQTQGHDPAPRDILHEIREKGLPADVDPQAEGQQGLGTLELRSVDEWPESDELGIRVRHLDSHGRAAGNAVDADRLGLAAEGFQLLDRERLAADLAGILGAILVTYFFFG